MPLHWASRALQSIIVRAPKANSRLRVLFVVFLSFWRISFKTSTQERVRATLTKSRNCRHEVSKSQNALFVKKAKNCTRFRSFCKNPRSIFFLVFTVYFLKFFLGRLSPPLTPPRHLRRSQAPPRDLRGPPKSTQDALGGP